MAQAVDEAGNIWEVDAQGNPVRFVGNANQQRSAGGVQIKPADPKMPYVGPQAGADLQGSRLDNEYKQTQIDDARRGKLETGYRWSADGTTAERIPGLPAVAPTAAETKAAGENKRARVIKALMGDVRGLYNQNLKGGWANGISGRLPALVRPENEEFNSAANGILPLIRPLVAQSAKEGDSDKEMEVFMAYIPKSSDSDQTIERKLNMLETLIGGMVDGNAPSTTVRDIDEGKTPDPLGGDLRGRVSSNQGPAFGPNGPIDGPPPPSGGVPGASQRDTFLGAVDAAGRHYANAGTLGLADRIAAAGNAIVPLDNLFGADNKSIWDGSSLNDAYRNNLALQKRTNAADEQVNPIASATGDVGGSINGMMLANQMLTRLGAGGLVAKTGGAAGDVAYGTGRGAVEGGPQGALIGGGVAAGTGALGRYVVGPTVGALAASRPGQAVINTVGRGANAVANGGRGLIGRRPVPFRPANLPSSLSGGERVAMARLPKDIQSQLADAERMGLPLSLADTSPQLQTLAGSVVRKSPDAYTMARETLGSRALGQADRAQAQIARNFGPLDNPNRMAEKLTEQARTAAGPLYREAYAQPSVSTPELESLLKTPFAREAVGRAEKIAANERRDPRALGFARNEAGDIVLNPSPINEMDRLQAAREGWDAANSNLQAALAKREAALNPGQFTAEVRSAEQGVTDASRALDEAKAAMQRAPSGGQVTVTPGYSPQTLDYTKRGMDDVLERYRNPITHRLDLDEAGRAENAVLRQFLSEVDANNPAYQMARQAYGGPASMRTALGEGRDVLNKAPRDIADQISGYSGPKLDMYRLGARTAMSDAVDKVRYSSNPYQNIYGSPVAQERAATVFGAEPAAGMKSAYDMEQRMAQTAYDTLGGSPTAMRAAADEAFDNGLPGLVLDAGTSYFTGSGGQGLTQKALTKIVDNARLRGSKKRADQLAPILFNTDPAAIRAAIESLSAKSLARDVYVKRARKAGGLFGASAGVGIAPSLR